MQFATIDPLSFPSMFLSPYPLERSLFAIEPIDSNVSQDDDTQIITIKVYVPRVNKRDVTVRVERGGKSIFVEALSKTNRFVRRFKLATRVDPASVTATLQNGVLEIIAPKDTACNDTTRTIQVEVVVVVAADKEELKKQYDENQRIFAMDVPGVEARNIRVTLHPNQRLVEIEARRKRPEGKNSKRKRRVKLGNDLDANSLVVQVVDGVLYMMASKKEEDDDDASSTDEFMMERDVPISTRTKHQTMKEHDESFLDFRIC